MGERVDLVALSLLWTEKADRRPRRRSGSTGLGVGGPGSGESPAANDAGAPDAVDSDRPGVWALLDLDEALDRLGAADPRAAAAALRERARRAIADGQARGFGLVARGEPDYPALLERIPDPPPVLWTRGSVTASEPAVAIVGSRVASPHGLEMAFRLGRDLARARLLVVSGMARGVDAAAHRGALRAGGRTAAVLGCGVDVAYPAEHDRLAQEIEASGSVMSEFAPGTPPSGWHFPRRNRIISGLSLGVVIVEAAHHSGSLITARCALDQGRSVMAVPGPVLSGRNRGAHALLRDGAAMVEEAADVIETLRADWMRAAGKVPPGVESDSIPQGPSGVESDPILRDPVVRRMRAGETYTLEDLAQQTGLGPAALLGRLARLEVDGQVRRVEGGRFVKAGRTC